MRTAGNQKAGAPFVPEGWSDKYKPALGAYKQLLGCFLSEPSEQGLFTDVYKNPWRE